MILLFFNARQKDIKNGSCKWSPCIIEMEDGDKERLGVIIGIRIRIKSKKSMKNEFTSALNILVIDKNLYLFPELFLWHFYRSPVSTLPLT